jgi:hypothetical protein
VILRQLRAATAGLWLALAGCTSMSLHEDGDTSWRYSAFDFSGDSWTRQKQRCEALSMKPRHLGTECGFWACTSRYRCQPPAGAPAQSSVAQ